MDEPRQWASDTGVSRLSQPVLVRRIREGDFERTATQLGKVAGNAVAVYRGVRRILKEQKKERKQESGGLGDWARERAEERRRTAAERLSEWRWAAWDKAAELRRRGQNRTREQEYPLHVVLAAGAVGLLLGVVLGVLKAHSR
jgi:hypothetical protein